MKGVRTCRRKLTCPKEHPNKFFKITPIRKPKEQVLDSEKNEL